MSAPGPSDELSQFSACFYELGEKTDEAAGLRKAAFSKADPNGNGLCSLAELETWMLAVLMAKHPKNPKKKDSKGNPLERGKDLWDAFRPSYIRAFNDAKDFKADTGKVIEGTKSATDDDFVSKGEFRLFCAYVCIYASMVRKSRLVRALAVANCPSFPGGSK